MKYLLMCCTEEKKLTAMSKSECSALQDETSAYCEALQKNGHLIVAEALEPVQAAITVRVRHGTLSTTDGPFAETKEQFGRFFSSTPETSIRPFKWPRSFHRCASGAWRCGRSWNSTGTS